MKHWFKVKPHYIQAQGPPLFAKVSFARIDPADWTVSGYNHPVSTSVFSVRSYLLVFRLVKDPNSISSKTLFYLVNADVLLFCLHHPNPLFPHLINYSKNVDDVGPKDCLQDSVEGDEGSGASHSGWAVDHHRTLLGGHALPEGAHEAHQGLRWLRNAKVWPSSGLVTYTQFYSGFFFAIKDHREKCFSFCHPYTLISLQYNVHGFERSLVEIFVKIRFNLFS